MESSNLKNKRNLMLLSLIISSQLFSGCSMEVSRHAKIPKVYKSELSFQLENKDITNYDLMNLKEISLNVDALEDLSWLNKCKNLEKLTLNFNSNDMNCLKELNGFPNLKEFKVNSTAKGIFNEENFGFLQKTFVLNKLTVENLEIDSEFLEQFNKVTYLSLDHNFMNTNISFDSFPYLSVLDFQDMGIYDVMMFLNDYDCSFFQYNNTVILANNGQNVTEDIFLVNDELKDLMYIIGINELDSDEEKLNKILFYILYKFEYDPLLDEWKKNYDIGKIYYSEGYLNGALNNYKGRIICGNYAALFEALAKRSDLESYFIYSKTHAYNLVNIDNKYYLTDPTFLDNQFFDEGSIKMSAASAVITGHGRKLDWYLEDPNIYHDDAHKSLNIPYNIRVVEKEEVQETEDFRISINGKDFVTIGMLGLLAMRIINLKKNNKEINELKNKNNKIKKKTID